VSKDLSYIRFLIFAEAGKMALNLTRGTIGSTVPKPKPPAKSNIVTLTADQLAAITGTDQKLNFLTLLLREVASLAIFLSCYPINYSFFFSTGKRVINIFSRGQKNAKNTTAITVPKIISTTTKRVHVSLCLYFV